MPPPERVAVGGARAQHPHSQHAAGRSPHRSAPAARHTCCASGLGCWSSTCSQGAGRKVGAGWARRWRRRRLRGQAPASGDAHRCCPSGNFSLSPGHFIRQAISKLRRDFAPLGTLVALDPRDRLQSRWRCHWHSRHFWACAQALAKSMVVAGLKESRRRPRLLRNTVQEITL